MDLFNTLQSLTAAKGTSGHETSAAETALKLLSGFMPAQIDKMGNVVGKTTANGKGILLDAHLDQVGLVVTSVDDKGFVKLARVGWPDPVVLSNTEVTVHGKSDIIGVIASTPPHLLKSSDENEAPDFSDVSVDVMLTKKQADSLISPGDRVSFNMPLKRMLGTRVCGASLDDRCGILSILYCLELLGDKLAEIPLTVVFSACEEVGGSGACTASFSSDADCAIAVDVSFAKAPGVPESVTAKLGDGVLVGFSPFLDRDISLKLTELAEKHGISHSREIMGGSTGTNADEISVSAFGKKTALLSIPLRNMHTPVEVIDLEDVRATGTLMCEFIKAYFEV